MTLSELADQLKQRDVVLAVAAAREAVVPELERFGVTEKIGREHIFASLEEAIAAFKRTSPAR